MLCSLQSPGRHNETPRFVFQNNSLIRLEQNSFLASYRRQKEASPGGATYLKGQVSSRSGSWTSPSVLRSPDAPPHLRPRALGWDNPHPAPSLWHWKLLGTPLAHLSSKISASPCLLSPETRLHLAGSLISAQPLNVTAVTFELKNHSFIQ